MSRPQRPINAVAVQVQQSVIGQRCVPVEKARIGDSVAFSADRGNVGEVGWCGRVIDIRPGFHGGTRELFVACLGWPEMFRIMLPNEVAHAS